MPFSNYLKIQSRFTESERGQPSDSEVRAAHAKAVGGKRDKCKKGKSCSAACIERSDRCLLDFPEPASRATTKLRNKIEQPELFPSEKYIDRGKVREIRDFRKKVERSLIKAIHLGDEDSYDRNRQKIIDFNKRVGEGASSALKVPATWDRVQSVKQSYEKAKGKIIARLEKAAKEGDSKKYQEEEGRLLKIKRNLGVKVGDTARYFRKEIWYRLDGGLTELERRQKPKRFSAETPKSRAKGEYERSLKMMRMASRMNDRNLFDSYAAKIQRLKERVKAEGIPYRVGSIPSWEKLSKEYKDYDKKFSKFLKKIEKDAASGNTKAANKGVDALYKLHLTEGSKFGGSFPSEKVEYARRGGSLSPSPTTTRLPPIKNSEDFKEIERWTERTSVRLHDKFANFLNLSSYYGSSEREKIMERLGVGESTFAKAINLIKRYTGTYYEVIKDAHKLIAAGKPLSPDYKKSLTAERALNRFIEAFPKEEVPKFRGGRVTEEKLRDLVESAKMKGSFSSGTITSWSSELEVARRFADRPPGSIGNKPFRVITQTVNRRGIAIESITDTPGEMELLTSGRARYRYTGDYRVVNVYGEDYHIFDVIEY